MAMIKLVPDEDWNVLKKYFRQSYGFCVGMVLIPYEVLRGLPEESQRCLKAWDGFGVAYNFGGEPDFQVDLVTGEDSNFLKEFFGDVDAAEGG